MRNQSGAMAVPPPMTPELGIWNCPSNCEPLFAKVLVV